MIQIHFSEDNLWKLKVNYRCSRVKGRVEAADGGGGGREKRKFSIGNVVIDMGKLKLK